VEKLAQAGLVQLKHAGRSVMVELNEGAEGAALKATAPPEADSVDEAEVISHESSGEPLAATGEVVQPPPAAGVGEPRHTESAGAFRPGGPPPMQAIESQAEGVKRVGETLRAAVNARWPMYLRNVKQLLRAADGGFDERRYGFGGLVDLVRACQKEGLVRLERDRRGGLRVFPGTALQQRIGLHDAAADATSVTHEQAEHHQRQMDTEFHPGPVDVEPGNAREAAHARDAGNAIAADSEAGDHERMPTSDPTAELLGTSTRRKRPTRAAPVASTPARRGAKNTARKPAAPRRAARAKKNADS
jgi:hypothetical protein